MRLFGMRQSGREIAPGRSDALIERHAAHSFSASDVLRLPAGWEAILVRSGAFSPVLREGDDRLPIEGRRAADGDLYFIRLSPEEAFSWGCGGVRIGGRLCGLHGTLRLEVSSSRKLLSAFIGEGMPFAAERAFDRLLDPLLEAVRACAQSAASPTGAEGQIASDARRMLEEPFERFGLCVSALTVEGVFIAPEDEEE